MDASTAAGTVGAGFGVFLLVLLVVGAEPLVKAMIQARMDTSSVHLMPEITQSR